MLQVDESICARKNTPTGYARSCAEAEAYARWAHSEFVRRYGGERRVPLVAFMPRGREEPFVEVLDGAPPTYPLPPPEDDGCGAVAMPSQCRWLCKAEDIRSGCHATGGKLSWDARFPCRWCPGIGLEKCESSYFVDGGQRIRRCAHLGDTCLSIDSEEDAFADCREAREMFRVAMMARHVGVVG